MGTDYCVSLDYIFSDEISNEIEKSSFFGVFLYYTYNVVNFNRKKNV